MGFALLQGTIFTQNLSNILKLVDMRILRINREPFRTIGNLPTQSYCSSRNHTNPLIPHAVQTKVFLPSLMCEFLCLHGVGVREISAAAINKLLQSHHFFIPLISQLVAVMGVVFF